MRVDGRQAEVGRERRRLPRLGDDEQHAARQRDAHEELLLGGRVGDFDERLESWKQASSVVAENGLNPSWSRDAPAPRRSSAAVGAPAPRPAEWGGAACQLPTCKAHADCSGHGVCASGVCACAAGRHGANCTVADCPKGCSGHGECDEESGACACADGWGGADCATPPACPGGGVGRSSQPLSDGP